MRHRTAVPMADKLEKDKLNLSLNRSSDIENGVLN